jgi:hypothetical protein
MPFNNIGKCPICKHHLIYEEVPKHFRMFHHWEYMQAIKKQEAEAAANQRKSSRYEC